MSLAEVRHLTLIWAIESMASHRVNKVIFETEDVELVGAVKRPRVWPSYRAYAMEIKPSLSNIPEWELEVVSRKSNMSTFLIARSVTMYMRLESYVARGEVAWLRGLFAEERLTC
ncbi:unnamed protein product [Brassica oleracea]